VAPQIKNKNMVTVRPLKHTRSLTSDEAVKKIPRRTIRGGREIRLQQIGYVQEDQTNGVEALVGVEK
jgi:hypothetical protein